MERVRVGEQSDILSQMNAGFLNALLGLVVRSENLQFIVVDGRA